MIQPPPRRPVEAARGAEPGCGRGRGIWHAISARAEQHAKCRLTFLSRQWPGTATVDELLRRAEDVSANLAARGFRPGDVLAVQLPHGEANTLILLAAIRLGVIVAPLVPILGASEVGFILRETRAKGIVIPARFRNTDYPGQLRRAGDLPDCQHVLVLGDAPEGTVPLAALLDGKAQPVAAHEANGDSRFAIIYTSGTTSAPKGVIHSHNSFEAEMLALGTLLRPPWSGGFLNVLPAGHIAGLIASLRAFFHGIDCVYMEQWSAAEAVAAIREHDLVCSSANGYHLSQILAEKGPEPLGRFRAILLGGAVIDPAIIARADEHGIQAFRAYGSSELPSLTCGAPWEPLEARSRTDGTVTAGNELTLMDEGGSAVPPGDPGEILCRGEELFQGFVDATLNDDAFTRDGWYRTGDIGVLRPDGRLTIVDRKKDIIIRGGENLSSREIEETLATHPGVRACAVIGLTDPIYGERVAAFVEADAGVVVSLETIGALFRRAGVARQKTPEALYRIDALPRTAAGKVMKAELRRRLAQGEVTTVSPMRPFLAGSKQP